MEKVSIVHTAVQYTCKYIAKVYLLVFKNYLSVTSTEKKIILPFIMRETGLVFKDTEKIHAMYPSMEDHSIYSLNFGIHIMLFLHGVLS